MATQGRKKVNIQYRKFDDNTTPIKSHTFQSILSESLRYTGTGGTISDSVTSRLFDRDSAYGTLVLNYIENNNAFFFGEIVRFEPGADLPLLKIGSNVKAYNLTQAKAPYGHEPIRGVLYFMAIGNHVMVLESDVSASRAETYLSWLLDDVTGCLTKGSHVILVAELSAQAGSVQLSEVEQVTVKPRAIVAAEPQISVGSPTVTKASRDVSEVNTMEVLKAAGMDDTDIQKLVESDTKIEVTLQIKFKGGHRRKPLGIDDANRLLRNMPEDQIVLNGPGGRQKEGRIVKLSYPANIELIGSLLDTQDVARALHESYKYFVSNGYIDG